MTSSSSCEELTHETGASEKRRSDRRAWWALALLVGPILMVSMDGSVLFLAMPRITDALGPSASEQLWILDVYGFFVAGLLITMGNLGDRYGRLRLMWLGAAIFGIGSVLGAFAASPEILIAARALMGIGGSTLLPSSLAILGSTFADPRKRSIAIGIWAAMFGAGFAVGPLAGAVLLERFWWGSVFLLNIPIVGLFLLASPFLLREVRSPSEGRVDLLSVVLSFAGTVLVVYSLKTLAAEGFHLLSLVTGVAGIAMVAVFVRRQSQRRHPLVKLDLFQDKVFTLAIIAAALSVFSYAAASYLGGIYLQTVLDRPVLVAGLLALPAAVTVFVFSTGSGLIRHRVSPQAILVAAFAFMGAGLLLLVLTGVDGGVAVYAVATAISGVGYGLVFAVASETAVTSVPPAQAGAAAAISETSFELGQALGLALLGSLAAAIFRTAGPGIAETLDATVLAVGAGNPAAAMAKQAFVQGFHAAMVVAGVLNLALAVIAARLLSRSRR